MLYSRSSLLKSQHMHQVTRIIMHDRVVPYIASAAGQGVIMDGLDLSYCLCSDYLSAFLFGLCNGSRYLLGSRDHIGEWRLHYENNSCHESFFPQEMPLVNDILRRVGIDTLPKSYTTSKQFLEDWMTEMTLKADHTEENHRLTKDPALAEDQPVVYSAVKAAVEKDSPHLTVDGKRLEVASEMFDHICKLMRMLQ
jgi:hypothetical protein